MANIGELYATIGADTSQLGNASRAMSNFVSGATSGFSKLNKTIVGVTAVIGSMAATMAAIKITKTGMEFEQTMTIVKGVSKATSEEFVRMNEIVRNLGATTEWTATQAGEAMKFLSMAGFEASESIKALPGTLDLATAGAIDLGRAADIATNALTAMGLKTEQLDKVNDTFVATITRTNTNMEMMAESFKYGAPMAKAFGYDIDELATMIGLLGNAGIQGSMAGTQLAFSIQKGAKYAHEQGLESAKLIDILKHLNETKATELEYMDIFGQRGGRAMLVLKNMVDEYYELEKQIRGATGEAKTLAEMMRSTLKASFDKLWSAVNEVVLKIYELFAPNMKTMVDGLTEAITGLGEHIKLIASSLATLTKIILGLGLLKLGTITIPLIVKGMMALVAEIQLMNVRLALAPGLWGKLSTSLTGVSLTAQFASKELSLAAKSALGIKTALGVVTAAFVGWEIGTWLSENFEEARISGVMMVDKLVSAWNWLKYVITYAIEFWSGKFESWIYDAKNLFAGFVKEVGEKLQHIPFLGGIGAENIKWAEEYMANLESLGDPVKKLNQTLKDLDDKYEETKKTHKEIIDSMLLDAIEYEGSWVGVKKKVDDITDSVRDQEKAIKDLKVSLGTIGSYSLSTGTYTPAEGQLTYSILGNQQALVSSIWAGETAADVAMEMEEVYTDFEKSTEETFSNVGKLITDKNQKAFEETQKQWDHTLENIHDETARVFKDIFSGTIKGWKDLFDRVKGYFFDILAEMLAKAVANPIVVPIVASMVGGLGLGTIAAEMGGTTAQATQGASVLGNLGIMGNIPGLSSIGTGISSIMNYQLVAGQPTYVGAGITGTTGGATLGTALGAGALGGIGYTTLGNWMGLPQGQYSGLTASLGSGLGYVGGAATGAAIGGTLGSVVPVIGTIIGALIGGWIGSLGGAEYELGTYHTDNFNMAMMGTIFKDTKWQEGLGITIGNLIVDAVGGAAAGATSYEYAGIPEGYKIIQAYADTRDAVVEQFNTEIFSWLETVPETMREGVEEQLTEIDFSYTFERIQRNAKNLEEDITDWAEEYYGHLMEQFSSIFETSQFETLLALEIFIQNLEGIIYQHETPDYQKAIDNLQIWYDAQVEYLETLDISGEQMVEIMKKLNEATTLQLDAIVQRSETALDVLKSFTNDILTSDLVPVQSIEAIQNEFTRLMSVVKEEGTAESAQELVSYITGEYLPFMKASGGESNYKDFYKNIIDLVEGTIQGLEEGGKTQEEGISLISPESFLPVIESQQEIVEAISDQTQALVDAQVYFLSQMYELMWYSLTEEEIRKLYGGNVGIASYQSGVEYVPRTGMYTLHEGESVVSGGFDSTEIGREIGAQIVEVLQGGDRGIIQVNIDGKTLLEVVIDEGEKSPEYQKSIRRIKNVG